MEERMKSYMELEDILHRYERQTALIDVLQMVFAECEVGVVGMPENAVEYALYEICIRMREINQELQELIRGMTLPGKDVQEKIV